MMFSHYNTGLIFVPAQKRIQYSVNTSSSQKKYDRKLPKAVALLMQRIFSEVKPMSSIVAVSKTSKLEPFSALDVQSVLNLM